MGIESKCGCDVYDYSIRSVRDERFSAVFGKGKSEQRKR